MFVLYVIPAAFVVAVVLWALAIALFGVFGAWQVGHDLAASRKPARALAAPAAPFVAEAPPADHWSEYLAAHKTFALTMPYAAALIAIGMWVTFLIIAYSR